MYSLSVLNLIMGYIVVQTNYIKKSVFRVGWSNFQILVLFELAAVYLFPTNLASDLF